MFSVSQHSVVVDPKVSQMTCSAPSNVTAGIDLPAVMFVPNCLRDPVS